MKSGVNKQLVNERLDLRQLLKLPMHPEADRIWNIKNTYITVLAKIILKLLYDGCNYLAGTQAKVFLDVCCIDQARHDAALKRGLFFFLTCRLLCRSTEGSLCAGPCKFLNP